MAFDQSTRNRLARFVGDSRSLLTEEFTRQLQHEYGLDPASGEITDLSRLGHLDDARRETARLLRETLAHYLAGQPKQTDKIRREALARIVREQAFTILNRLCALRMLEGRGLLLDSVSQGYQSRGFQLYSRLAGPALGETGDTYRSYLISLFDEFALDLPVLFDRFSPQGRLFPGTTTLLKLLDEINHPDIDPLWAEDETIGWIYQYFNSVEERKQMRAESQAPRNSRELAVRNQFFTPRYVVEFLTDNTLGRIWYEMTQGQTTLAATCRYLVRRPAEIFLARGESPPPAEADEDVGDEGLSQEDLLKQPVYIPHRPLKDPRELKMLDPACGSMHFGLYAFDLYEQIYAEAWALEAERGPRVFTRSTDLKSLHEAYSDEATFRRNVPRLIIEYNIHGIDIDPRAAQIAGLSLWLRAQKSWQSQGVKATERPTITRSNVVTAEPMPGDTDLLDEFIDSHLSQTPEEKLLGQLLRRVFAAMTLAGEAGALLKIEEAIAADIAEAKAAWYAQPEMVQPSLFAEEPAQPEQASLALDISGITEEAFWEQAEGRIYAALQAYAEQAENGQSYRRRLFAGDAAKGFAFIDLCRQRYDVVLMNPPFGDLSRNSKKYIEVRFPASKGNILTHFLEHSATVLTSYGKVGAIISRTCFFLTTFDKFRLSVLGRKLFLNEFADLGSGVLDAMVETAAATFSNNSQTKNNAAFFRMLTSEKKDKDIAKNIQHISDGILPVDVFEINPFLFRLLDSSPYVYWITSRIIKRISNFPTLESEGAEIRVGLQTGNDFRFLRLWYEVPNKHIVNVSKTNDFNSLQDVCLAQTEMGCCWSWYSKIDEASPFVASIHLVVNWNRQGREIKAAHVHKGHSYSKYVMSESAYYRPGISYMLRSSRLIPYIVPRAVIPTAGRSQIYPKDEAEQWVLALVSSNLGSAVARFRGENFERPVFQNSMVGSIPYTDQYSDVKEKVEQKLHHAISTQKENFAASESCIEFLTIQNENRLTTQAELLRSTLLGPDLDQQIGQVYGFNETEFGILERDVIESSEEQSLLQNNYDESLTLQGVPSYALGCVFGRWDLRYATGQTEQPELPDPFAPLPACPPGMIQNSGGLPATPEDVPTDYPLRITWPGILVDDPGHLEDIETRAREALRVIWPDNADTIEQEAIQILGITSLRAYFSNVNHFFDDHLKRYSKSRRAAPIYWPLSAPSGSYTLWLYYHRLDDQILYTCVNDFVDPKLNDVAQQTQALRQKNNRSKTEETDLAELTDLEAELQEFRTELLRLAAFWRPDLNDGVQITAAPLWRLFRHRQWQKRLKETWAKLEAGDYDWAHLAMSIWPERVVPKCVEDRSLAIAHDIENLFWVEDEGRWRLVQAVDWEIDHQITQRQQPAYERLHKQLTALAEGPGRGMPAHQVWQYLEEGVWDDTQVALMLWPERVAEKSWGDPFFAAKLSLKMPNKRTQAARTRFLKKLMTDGLPDMAPSVAVTFKEAEEAFDAVWQTLGQGNLDNQPLALVLWPERVVNKCVANLDLAAEHHLRRFFWVEPIGSPWRRRNPQAQEIREEIARRKNHTGGV